MPRNCSPHHEDVLAAVALRCTLPAAVASSCGDATTQKPTCISAADADAQSARPRAGCCLTGCCWAASAALQHVVQVPDSACVPFFRMSHAHGHRTPVAWTASVAHCWPAETIMLMPSEGVCTWEPICDRCSEGGAPLEAGSSASRAPFSLAGGFLRGHNYVC